MSTNELEMFYRNGPKITYDKTFTCYKIQRLNVKIIDKQLVLNNKLSLCGCLNNENDVILKLDSVMGIERAMSNRLTLCVATLLLILLNVIIFCTSVLTSPSSTSLIISFFAMCLSICISIFIATLIFKKKVHIVTLNKVYTYSGSLFSSTETKLLWDAIITEQKSRDENVFDYQY